MTNNKQQTAVEWLIEKHFGGIENCTPDFRHKIEQAKEREANVATEYAEFCIRCDRASLKQVKFEDWKKSWDETFNQQEQ
jgi:hypothetical protein